MMGPKSMNPTRRKLPSRDKKPVVYIFCEGEKTEPNYFAKWRERGMSVHVLPTSHSDPVGIVRDAKQKISERSFEPDQGDSVWCVYDVDNNTDEILQRAFRLAIASKYNVVVSNPCFEIWYLLHYETIGSALTSAEAQRRLLKHISQYTKSVDVFATLEPLIDTANKNAVRLAAKYSGQADPVTKRACNPYSNAYELVGKLNEMRQRARRRR